jgi:hypothetical protein
MNARWLVRLLALLLPAYAAAGELPLAWRGSVEIAAGGGERGPWRQNESRYDYVDDGTVAMDERGGIAVAWVDQASKDVLFRRFSADGGKPLGEPANVSRSGAIFSWLPRVALAPGDPRRVFVLWQEIIFSGGSHGGDILFARSTDGGSRFSAPRNLSSSIGGAGKGRITRDFWHNGSLDLAVGADGALYAVWTEYEGGLWFSRSRDGGESFTPARRLAGDDALPARAPSLALAPDGTLYLAWTVGEDKAADPRISASRDGGESFAEPRIVARSNGYADAPKLAVDREGVVHLAYGESADGPFGLPQVRYTRSSDGARSFEPVREISRPSPGDVPGAGFPALALDAQRNLYLVWELFHAPLQRPRGLAMAVSRDGGRSFSGPALVPESFDPAGGRNGSQQGLLMNKLAVSRDGTVAIVNSSLNPDEGSRVWMILGALR